MKLAQVRQVRQLKSLIVVVAGVVRSITTKRFSTACRNIGHSADLRLESVELVNVWSDLLDTLGQLLQLFVVVRENLFESLPIIGSPTCL